MAYDTEQKSSAQLQREIEMQRNRVENTIDEIQAKLSPGQLVDELLAYTKGGGGAFVSTLQRQVTANPLPVALLGVSLAWLMAKPQYTASPRDGDRASDEEDYPVSIIAGTSLRRQGYATDAHGRRVSRFADEAGKTYEAQADEHGHRAGHFVDEAGNRFKGFTDATGARIEHFRDEAGNLLDDASGWASHTWQKARERMHDLRDAAGSGMQSGRSQAGHMAGSALHQAEGLQKTVLHQFRDQPLVGGALAFALGAALGSALPHTREEDKLMGEAADALKAKAGSAMEEGYQEGREKAAEVYESATEKAAELYDQVKEGLSTEGKSDARVQ